jgi:hypothetical protein
VSLTILFSAVLVGPQFNPSAQFWREEYQSVMQASAERAQPRPETAVPRLIKFYSAVEAIDVLPQAERMRMRKSLESRLVKQLEELLRERRRHERRLQQVATRSSPQSFSGGGSALATQQLIDVIVTTIAPDSWQQRGGQGSISFYPQNPALIIRQTKAVHEEISELLRALR